MTNNDNIDIAKIAISSMEEDCAYDQPCKFGLRCGFHAVYCENYEWENRPRKCRRSWYTGGEEKDEDCDGYKENSEGKKIFDKSMYIMLGFFGLVIYFLYNQIYYGLLGLILLGLGFQALKLWRFYKAFPGLKDIMLSGIKDWERNQLGYDLDDPYWEGKKRPTLWQKLRGKNPNK